MVADDLLRIAQFNPHVPAGQAFLVNLGHGIELWARHPADLTPQRMGTRWHTSQVRCPTWTDAAECRCMVEAS